MNPALHSDPSTQHPTPLHSHHDRDLTAVHGRGSLIRIRLCAWPFRRQRKPCS
ncbi:hypothetical protein M407DRAFT_144532 [Tulasnella calospora MUT 4182]|uniref:Uncharacterized protein n=1 Tax=Tulasnella calospora MUT 4182 TaxID=1051891 RepID=A0A0C3LEE7_9AGAM|nr:hypothetical protein M407DRAFT_144532 [Tulasnella calospora MUT 4182]